MPNKLAPPPVFGSLKLRKSLSAPALLQSVRTCFKQVPEYRKQASAFCLPDALMSGLAVFALKDASLLAFDQQREEKTRRHNLLTLYGIKKAPCDTQIRTILDGVNPHDLRPSFLAVHQELQKQGILDDYRFMGKYLVSLDGTGEFGSNAVHCPDCCTKQHKDGTVSYYHQMLAAVMVHPDKKNVLPFYPEAITRQDGVSKNDCEHNASKRLIPALRKDFPRLEMIILQDALSCNGPHIKLLKEQGYSFIITAKPKANSLLLKTVLDGLQNGATQELEVTDEQGGICGFRFANDVPLNHENQDLKVNYIDYWEKRPDGKTYQYACVADITLTAENVADVVRAGRSRWKIENETFNTLKNQGYNLEHNYGHGKKHLSSVFACLMMLAFFLDQVQENCCRYFQAARGRFHSRTALWSKMRSLFDCFLISDWESFYAALIWGREAGELLPHRRSSA
jgi:hypothetical protein